MGVQLFRRTRTEWSRFDGLGFRAKRGGAGAIAARATRSRAGNAIPALARIKPAFRSDTRLCHRPNPRLAAIKECAAGSLAADRMHKQLSHPSNVCRLLLVPRKIGGR